jgi:hypothetical protein
MSDNWASCSEIVAGKILKGKLALNVVRPEIFIEPYDRIIELMQSGHKEKEDIISIVGLSPVTAAMDAANAVQNDRVDWVSLLEKVATKCQIAAKLRQHAKKLDNGEDIDSVEVVEDLRQLDREKPYMIPLTEVETDPMPFIPSGLPFIDNHISGWPKSGLISIGAKPGDGKTTFLIKAAAGYVRYYSDKKVGVFTLEMPASEFKSRVCDLEPDLTTEQLARIVVEDAAELGVRGVANKAAREPDLGLVCVDFADLMIPDENTESEMAKIYRVLAGLAKTLGVPVILLCQFSKEYRGGVPLPRYFRYTSLAEALSWMMLCLYNPARDYSDTNDRSLTLPQIAGESYVVAWKIRGGFRLHELDNPGAIRVKFSGKVGWGSESTSWNKLHIE